MTRRTSPMLMNPLFAAAALCATTALVACQEQPRTPAPHASTPPTTRADEPAPATPAETAPAAPVEPSGAAIDPPPADAMIFTSNDGAYRIACRVLADPIPVNEPFDLEIWVMDLESERAAAHEGVHIDAAMPHHRHGMNQYPVVTKQAEGRYHVDGMLFHMPGYWEIYVDVEDGLVVERGQVSVDVE